MYYNNNNDKPTIWDTIVLFIFWFAGTYILTEVVAPIYVMLVDILTSI